MTEQHNFTKPPPHVLLFPFPAQGHVNPMIQFAKRLLSKGVKSTLVTTTFFFNSTHPNNNTTIQIEHVSDGFDDGGLASADSPETYVKTFKEVGSRSLADLINKLLQSDQGSTSTTIDAMICDSVVPWFLDVGKEFGISGGLFFTQACAVSRIYYHVHKGLIPLPPGGKVSVPGLPEVEWWEMPSFVHSPGAYPAWGEMMFDQFSNIDRATWVFSTSFYQLEKEVIEWMRTMWNMKVIGPTLPSMYLDKCLKDDQDYSFNLWKPNNTECMNWLNQKSKKSVVYVSFGSVAQLSPEQTNEIAWALIDSGMNFLWVVRAEEEAKLPQNFVKTKSEKGLIVSWCKQLDVLAHESVGCFVTHCGFNSTLEAVSLGVPIVGMPQWTDQTTNAKCLEDIWGVGIRVKADENGIVTRGNILSCIKMIMDEERGSVARMNAKKWMDFAKEAVDEGGSSDKDIDEFVCELKHRC